MAKPLASLEHNALYERLGGRGCLSLIVEKWCERILADGELVPYLCAVDLDNWQEEQTNFLIQAVGGVLPEPSPPLPSFYLQLPASRRHVERLLGHLVAALVWANIPWQAIEETLEAVTPLIPAAHTVSSDRPRGLEEPSRG